MSKTYYKVVHQENNRYISAIQNKYGDEEDNPCETEYKINEFVESPIKGSILFAFSNLNSAKDFLNYCFFNAVIFECEIGEIVKHAPFVAFGGCDGEQVKNHILFILQLQKRRKKWLDKTDRCNWKNTVFVKRIKLLKRVY